MITSLSVRGMHCQACVRRLTDALGAVPGVHAVRVTLDPPLAEVASTSPVTLGALDAAARTAGNYSLSPIGGAAEQAHTAASAATAPTGAPPATLYPLFLIVGYIAGAAALATYFRGARSPHDFMFDFMAGFFLVFSFFKLLDLRGFADAYASYDLIAQRSRAWALAYPFIELALGAAYLIRRQLFWVDIATLALMLIGSAGVLRALARKDRIRCACLGTALNLPMTTVTLVEDLAMAAMAAAGLLWTA